jgi:hypothetical protein
VKSIFRDILLEKEFVVRNAGRARRTPLFRENHSHPSGLVISPAGLEQASRCPSAGNLSPPKRPDLGPILLRSEPAEAMEDHDRHLNQQHPRRYLRCSLFCSVSRFQFKEFIHPHEGS